MNGVIGFFDDLFSMLQLSMRNHSFSISLAGSIFYQSKWKHKKKKNENSGTYITCGIGKQNEILYELASDSVVVQIKWFI